MNTYVMGEIAILLAVTVLAGILIGWCIKSLLSGRTERKVRAHVARDVDDAAADVANIRQTLLRREAQLKDANHELQKMRGRDMSIKAGSDTQVDEINKLKNELALARQSLDRNRTEFNAFRNEKLTELQSINNKLASYQSGGSVHDERMAEANETIGALRTAVRENDKVIDSLRARIKEGDSSVENLRSQLKASETSLEDIQQTRQATEATIATLNADYQEATAQRDKFKRDYDSMLENKNREITRQQQKLEELGKAQTTLHQKDHEYKKLQQESQDIANRSAEQLNSLKRKVTENESQRAESLKNLKRLQDQVTALEAKNKTLVANAEKQALLHTTQLQQASKELDTSRSLGKQVENKSAELIALNDMLKDVSNKRNEAQTRVKQLEAQLKTSDAQATADAERKIAGVTNLLQERDATIAKLRSELDDIVDSRNRLSIQLGELQTGSEKTKTALTKQSQQQIAQMQSALQDRDKSFEKLRSDMDQMASARDRLTKELEKLQQHGMQLETFKSGMETTVAQRDAELQQRKAAYDKLQQEFKQLSNTRDDYEKRISVLAAEVSAQSKLLKEQEKRTATEASQAANLRSRLSLADSENQKLNSELSNFAELNLAITERDSVIQKLNVDLQDAKMNTASNAGQEEASSKIESLTLALKDRDTELARLNNIVTDNRLNAKKQQSETTLLQQENESQARLIKGLEEQAENTLTLHKKIAAQSTEIEELRASMYRGDTGDATKATSKEIEHLKAELKKQNSETSRLTQLLSTGTGEQSKQSADLKLQVARLQSEVEQRNIDIQLLQKQNSTLSETGDEITRLKRQLEQRDRELNSARQQQSAPTKNQSTRQAANQDSSQSKTTATKPRVFVRQDNGSKATEALTGVAANPTVRATYTRDGYKLKHTNGNDNLALLPGISARAEKELNANGVAEFEQIALWSGREISHFAERAGVSAAEAERYNWPALARQILDGTFRKSEFEHTDNS